MRPIGLRVLLGLAAVCAPLAAVSQPENLALGATASASSEYSPQYAASLAIDGVIPELLSNDDAGRAWAVNGAEARHRATFVLEWPGPVTISEIVYYGRASWLVEECWKDYEVRLDDRAEPVAKGRFVMNAGPQRIKIPTQRARKITLDFLSSYGGQNPGAAELQVYAKSPSADQLPKLRSLATNHATTARVTASSEYSENYAAGFAIDSRIPEPLSHYDIQKSWAVRGAEARGKATFTLQWDEPVPVREVIYYARTAMLIQEGFKDYELWVDDDERPVARGAFLFGSGPQRIAIARRDVRKVTLKFLSSYDGANPGAAEIQVYDESPDPKRLPRFLKDGWDKPEESPELSGIVQEGKLGFDKLILIRRHEINPSHVYTVHCEDFQPGGGLCVLSPPNSDGELTEILASPDGQMLDYDLSFDARELVFSWRKNAGDSYHVHRMNVDGSGLTQLTDGLWHDYNARWLPDGGIVFVSTRDGQFAMCFFTPSGVLYRMDRNGDDLRKLSANYIDDFTPAIMPDGRILYSRWEYVDKPAIPIQSLWTISPDGTGLCVFYGNRVLSPASFLEARPIPGTDKIICTLTAHNGPIRGGLGIIDRRRGVNAQEAIVSLTPSVSIGPVDRGDGNHVRGQFENPYPLDSARFLVSGKGSVFVGDVSGRWAVIRTKPAGFAPGFYNPQPLRPRARPPVIASSLPNETNDWATVCLLDIYDGLQPHVKRGEIKQVCVVEELKKPLRTTVLGFGFQRPVVSCGATYAAKKIWGYAPVREDGSAYFRVPAGKPVYFEALDESGQALQRMRSFAHFPAGETRGCVGCHEPRHETPAVRRVAAFLSAPSDLQPPEWGLENFDYSRVVQPVLDRHCTKCHSGVAPPKLVDLTGGKTDWFNVSYDVLTRGYANWIDTRNGREQNILQIAPRQWGSPASPLAGLIISGHPDENGKPRIDLDDASRRRILAWIDLNVPYYGTYEMANPDAPGGRRIYPEGLDGALAEVSRRRCAGCHETGLPSAGFIRISDPEMTDFLLAPLAKLSGGRGSCGEGVFENKDDPDYRTLLALLEPTRRMLAGRPRMDMPGAVAAEANRSCR